MKKERLAAVAAGVIVACAVVAGLYVGGSPGEQRLLRQDEQRTQDLWAIAGEIDRYWERTGDIPLSLDDVMVGGRRLSEVPLDPVTGEKYKYDPVDPEEFQYRLCAEFARASKDSTRPDFWRHEAGRNCFSLSVGSGHPASLIPFRSRIKPTN